MTIAYVFFLPVEEQKWRKRNQSRVKEKPTTFFTKKPCSKTNVTQKSCTFWQHYRLVVVRFFLFWTFPAGFFVWDFSFNHEQHCYETAPEPLRRVKYSKHVKSDLCYYITWRNRPTELAGEHHLTRWMFWDYRTYLSPLQLKGIVKLVAVSQLSSYQPAKPCLLVGTW